MKNLLRFVSFLLMAGSAYAQSNLPACEGRMPTSWTNCFGTFATFLGNKYVGEFKDGRFNGQGTFFYFANDQFQGNKYVGAWKDAKRDGQGILYASNGSVINQGIWADDKFVRSVPVQQAAVPSAQPSSAERDRLAAVSKLSACPATGYFNNCFGMGPYDGGEFVGSWTNGQPSGLGKFTDRSSNTRYGRWEYGFLSKPLPTFEVESWIQNQKSYANSSSPLASGIQTNTQNPQILNASAVNSSSIILSACQGANAGRWSNCLGTFTFPGGDRIISEYQNGMRNGQGIEYGFDGTVLRSGTWKNDQLVSSHALDKSRFPFDSLSLNAASNNQSANFTMESALSQSNLPACPSSGYLNNCLGSYTYPNNWKYVGEWKDNRQNGQGTLFAANGTVANQGIWSDGKFVRSAPELQANSSVLTSIAERDRLTAEVEAERKKRQELEQQLAAAKERDRVTTELDAERRKRQELEEQLRVAQQSTQSNKQPVTSGIERRVALVIGNATYKVNPLKNPVNDSTDMARSLRSVGFDVIEANNATLTQMREVTRRFADKLSNSDVGLVYYSGHGVEVKGKNYLIPVGADIKREYEVVDQAFDASQFLEMMDNIRGPNNKRVNILIVDACRNNELQRSWRSTNNGLARMDAPGGTFISFATAPGRVAADGTGRNSPYTKHLLQALKQPNVPIEQVFKVVRRNVMEETKGEQVPWENSSLVGDFYFTVQR
jgi:antitoxin component YwqK of YwqJK toxin-antitoxin module